MNKINVPETELTVPDELLKSLADHLPSLTPELKKAATFVLENPNEVGVSSMREIADAAEVKPNTLVRMVRSIGLEGYEDFREPFREEIRQGRTSYPDRARWLQSLSRGGELGSLYADMAASLISNIESTFAETDTERVKAAADAIVGARHVYVLGVGVNHAVARNFAYLADMALDNVTAIPKEGSHPLDDLSRAGKGDVLVAITFKPYRTEVVDAVRAAAEQGVTVIGLSDSLASPLLTAGEHGFLIPTETPQFFTSIVATSAFLETLMAFVIADAAPDVIAKIEQFHQRRFDLGIYMEE